MVREILNNQKVSSVLVLTLSLILALSMIPMPVLAAENLVTGGPDLSISSPDGTFEASSSSTLTVSLSNNGEVRTGGKTVYEEEVKTARNIRVRVLEDRIDAPIEVQTGTQTLGGLKSGRTVPLQFKLEIGKAKPGTYRIPVKVDYEHTQAITYGPYRETERTNDDEEIVKYISIKIEDKPQFEIVAENENEIFAGDNHKLGFTIKNVGTRVASDSTVSFSSKTSGVFFGEATSKSNTASLFISTLGVNSTKHVSVNVGAREDVPAGTYPVSATVQYENENGILESSDPLQTGLSVRPERSFSLQNVTTNDFRVDEAEAEIRADFVNTGPAIAHNVVVELGKKGQIAAPSGESAIGDLEPGEREPVSFTIHIPESAEPGSKSFAFNVEYENGDGDLLQLSTPIRKSLMIKEERDRFEVVNVNSSVTPGGSGTVTVRLQYNGNQPVTNANAKLFTSDPLSSSDDGAHLGTIKPNETSTATFRVSASSNALVKEYSTSIEVRYDEHDGDTRFTGSLATGVPVDESDSTGVPVVPAALAGLGVALIGGFVIYKRT